MIWINSREVFSETARDMAHSVKDVLHKCSLFKRLDANSLELVSYCGRIVEFKKGEMIFRQGDPCPGLYCVAEGVVRVYRLAPSGKDHVIHFVEAGGTFAEVAVIGDFPCPAYADAAEDAECLLLSAERFRMLLKSNHAVCLQLLEGMGYWVRQLVGLLEDIVLRDAVGRVAGHILRAEKPPAGAPFMLPMLKKDLASHLNVTSETLSRTLRRLADADLVELSEPQKIRIINREALEGVAAGLPPAEFA